jgi:hypothetical protein
MRSRSWRSSVTAVTVLALQLGVSALGAIDMCIDRPHTNGGVPAPDCLMHHQPSTGAEDTTNHAHHHQHDNSPADTSARLACSCSADPLMLLATEIAVVPDRIVVPLLNPGAAPLSEPMRSVSDRRPAPLSPPPRASYC